MLSETPTGEGMKIGSWLVVLSLILVMSCSVIDGQSPASGVNDSAEAVRLKAVLLEADDLAGSAIDITIKQDTILLEGFVETDSQRSRAEDLMREHSDLDVVTNRIEVK